MLDSTEEELTLQSVGLDIGAMVRWIIVMLGCGRGMWFF